MSKRVLIFAPIIIVFSAVITLATMSAYKKYTTPKKVHYHAGFQVYVDEKLQDFSSPKYMKEVPCTVDGANETHKEDIQLEKAHLHDGVGNVVHVERTGAKWSDLLINIGYKLPNDKSLVSFVNGKKTEQILDYPIRPYDSVIIIVGKDAKSPELLKKSVTIEEIKEAEKSGESC